MTDADIEQRVADETTARLHAHNLKQAHERLADIRTSLRGVSVLVEDDPALTGRIATIIVNSIEPLMWKIETVIREVLE